MKTDYIQELAQLKRFGVRHETELAPDLPVETVITGTKTRKARTLGNPLLTARSQTIYAGPSTKAPGAAQSGLGTAPAADISGSWGKPSE